MTPILILFFGLQPLVAVATDLPFAAITKLVGTVNYLRMKIVSWHIVVNMAIGGVPGALFMSYMIRKNDFSEQLDMWVQSLLGIVLFITALLILFRAILHRFMLSFVPTDPRGLRWARYSLLAVASCGIGMLVSLTSVGGGAITMALLTLLYPSRRLVTLVGTDIVYTIVIASIATGNYFQLGIIDYGILFLLLAGSLPGVLLGSILAPKLAEKTMRFLLASIFVLLGFWMILV